MSGEKKVLVILGQRTRPVTIPSESDNDMKSLESAVFSTFADILPHTTSGSTPKLLFQVCFSNNTGSLRRYEFVPV